jgi:hypothetical protein
MPLSASIFLSHVWRLWSNPSADATVVEIKEDWCTAGTLCHSPQISLGACGNWQWRLSRIECGQPALIPPRAHEKYLAACTMPTGLKTGGNTALKHPVLIFVCFVWPAITENLVLPNQTSDVFHYRVCKVHSLIAAPSLLELALTGRKYGFHNPRLSRIVSGHVRYFR